MVKELYIETKRFFKNNVFLKKGVFACKYVTSCEKYDDTKLPPKYKFYSCLNHEYITDKGYEREICVWSIAECKTLGEYPYIYIKTDVLTFADIFENFQNVCMKTHDLDPCWYITCPGLASDAMLKKTQIQLETLEDINMILMFKAGIRGGISQCSHEYATAINKYMTDNDEANPSSFLAYFDMNNLYGNALS